MCSSTTDVAALSDADLRAACADAMTAVDQAELARAVLLAEIDRRDAYVAIGETSTASYIRAASWASWGEANSMVGVARNLDRHTVIAEAATSGTITLAIAKVLLTGCNRRTAERFFDDQAHLVDAAAGLTVAQTRMLIAYWKAHADPDGPEPTGPTTPSTVRTSVSSDTGRGELIADLQTEDHAIVFGELGRLAAATYRAEHAELSNDDDAEWLTKIDRSRGRLAAALVEMARRSSEPDREGRKPLVHVVVPLATIEERSEQDGIVIGGGTIPADIARRWACEGYVSRVVLGADGEILDVGRAGRLFPDEQVLIIRARDQGCAWPGCDAPPSWCVTHHIEWWERDNGTTAVTNGCLLCKRHHGLAHTKGWTLRWAPGGPDHGIEVERPDGTILRRPRPRGPLPWPADPLDPEETVRFVEGLEVKPLFPRNLEPVPVWNPADPACWSDRMVADAMNWLLSHKREVMTTGMAVDLAGRAYQIEASRRGDAQDDDGWDIVTRDGQGRLLAITHAPTRETANNAVTNGLTSIHNPPTPSRRC